MSSLSLRKARSLRSSFRRAASTDGGWDGSVDRDLVIAAHAARAHAQVLTRV